MRRHTGFHVPAHATVHIHQAFVCCPFAGMVTSQIHDWLEQNGYTVTPDPAAATAHIINTCGSDANQANLTFQALDAVRAVATDHPVVIAGCLNSIEPKRIQGALAPFAQHAMLDPRNLSALDELFAHDAIDFEKVPPSLKSHYSGTDVAQSWHHIGISTGCFGTCTFCAIRRATGRPRSTPIPDILAEVDRAVALGKRDILFVYTDASAWGTDLGLSIVDLLRTVADHPSDALFSAEAFEPVLFLEHFEALLPIFRSGRFAFIGLPIQSGSPRVLAQMGRTYAVSDVVAAARRLRDEVPELVVRTDFIFGFGDETDEEFEESMAISREFDVASWNVYQERPGTAPRLLPDDVLAERRQRVTVELRRRAMQGQKSIRRRDDAGDVHAPTDPGAHRADDTAEIDPTPPELRAWLEDHGGRFRRLLARKGALPLGRSGWSVRAAELDVPSGSIHLIAERPGSLPPVRFALGPPGARPTVIARSDRYELWVASGGWGPGDGRREALSALTSLLGLS